MGDRMSEYLQKKNRNTLARLVRYFGISKKKTALTLLLAAALNAATIAQPLVVMVVIDGYLVPEVFDGMAFFGLAALFMLLALLANGAGYMQSVSLRSLGQEILHKIRSDLFGKIQKMNMSFFDSNSSGRILTRVTSDVEALSELYSNIFLMAVRESLLVAGILAAMFMLDPVMALWCLASVPLVLLLTYAYRIIARRTFIKLKTILSQINGYLAENIIGMRIIQIFNRQKVKFKAFDAMNEEYYRLGMMEVVLNGLSNPVVTMISNLMVAFLIAAFHGAVTGGQLDIGVLFAFATFVRQLFQPIANLSEQLTTAQSAIISADRIFDIMDNEADAEDLKAGLDVERMRGLVEFRNVWFAYSGENWVLRDVSFRIEPGTFAAFVGTTGCGKTTVMNLLSRFYEIGRGKILLDGIDAKEISLHSIRRNIAVVIQDSFLFTGDIRYNIRLNNAALRNRDVAEAAQLAGIHGSILALRDGYLHRVAERGADLSLGQRQLISFARAVAAKPSLLVLDEATANIDSDTEKALQSGLEKFSRNKTVLAIAHRLSTIAAADVIFVIENGAVAERGPHEELMKIEGGIYRKLHALAHA